MGKQKSSKKKKVNKNTNQRIKKEKEDASRNVVKLKAGPEMSFITFIAIKIFIIAGLITAYFIYSPAMIFFVILYLFTFYFAIMTERRMNKNILKSSFTTIPKYDAAVALLLVCITVVYTFSSMMDRISKISNIGSKFFERMIPQTLSQAGSVLTGVRNVFNGDRGYSMSEAPPQGAPSGNISDIPLSAALGQILSNINLVLLCLMAIIGIITIVKCILDEKKSKKDILYRMTLPTNWEYSLEDLEKILNFNIAGCDEVEDTNS